jgi:hypothetical protein
MKTIKNISLNNGKFFKAFLIVLFCVVLSFGQKGYADLEFGMSPEQVKQKGYVLEFSRNYDGFMAYITSKGVSYPLIYRFFAFFDNKLMGVSLSYDISKVGADAAIIGGLVEKYGARFVKSSEENTYYYTANEHLQIEAKYGKSDYGEDILDIHFRGLKIQALYEEAQKKKYQKNLGF